MCLPDGLAYEQAALSAGAHQIDCDNLKNQDDPRVIDTDREPILEEDMDDGESIDFPPPPPLEGLDPVPGDPFSPPDIIRWPTIEFDPINPNRPNRPSFGGEPPAKRPCICDDDMQSINDVPVSPDTPMEGITEGTGKPCACTQTDPPKEQINSKGKICRDATKEEKVAVRKSDCQYRYEKCLSKAEEGRKYSWCSKKKRKPKKKYYRRRYYGRSKYGYRSGCY